MPFKTLLPLLIFFVAFFEASLVSGADEKVKVELIISEMPGAEYSGFYWAVQKGLYKKRSLDVSIIHQYNNKQPIDCLKNPHENVIRLSVVPFMNALISKDNHNIANILQLWKYENLVFIMKNSEDQLESRQRGILVYTDKTLPFLPVLSRINNFKHSKHIYALDGISLFVYSNAFYVDSTRYKEKYVETLFSDKYAVSDLDVLGFNSKDEVTVKNVKSVVKDIPQVPGSGLYVTKKILSENELVLSQFVEATLEGWAQSVTYKDVALDIVTKVSESYKLHVIKYSQREILDECVKNLNDNKAVDKLLFQKCIDYIKHEKIIEYLDENRVKIKLPYLDCMKRSEIKFPSYEEFFYLKFLKPASQKDEDLK